MKNSYGETKDDFVTWTRTGFNIESSKRPLSFQLDQQIRLNQNSQVFQGLQTRFFGHYKQENNIYSLIYILTNQRENNINNVFAFQFLNKTNIFKDLVWESRFRLEKRYETRAKNGNTEESWRTRFRGGLEYKIIKNLKLVLNNELFILQDKGFSENRLQSGFNIKLLDNLSLDLFYQKRYLTGFLNPNTLEHTIFTNLSYTIVLDS
ncbi:MAG: DUF2490 domain-containing protein [Candidatus Sericytochromatia bacterium]